MVSPHRQGVQRPAAPRGFRFFERSVKKKEGKGCTPAFTIPDLGFKGI